MGRLIFVLPEEDILGQCICEVQCTHAADISLPGYKRLNFLAGKKGVEKLLKIVLLVLLCLHYLKGE